MKAEEGIVLVLYVCVCVYNHLAPETHSLKDISLKEHSVCV